MINKYEENINTNLSFISNFDLEDIYKDNNSFNSEEDDNENYEIIENKTKNNKKVVNYRSNDEEVNDKLEKDFLDLKNFLLGNM